MFWFLREWLKENDYEMYEKYLDIKIVGINTYMEHKEILDRINKNCDIVLRPELKPFEVKEKYGSPCFSKFQDDMIDRYQRGCRKSYLLERINGIDKNGNSWHRYSLNSKARDLLLLNNLHKISPKCCEYLKKKPAKKYEKESGRYAILGVRSGESSLRKTQYTSCFNENGKFTPLWDMSDKIMNGVYNLYNIELPEIYNYISRSGCVSCVYGSYKGEVETELALATPQQRKFVVKYFKESYDILGIDYQKFLDEPNRDWKSELKKIEK